MTLPSVTSVDKAQRDTSADSAPNPVPATTRTRVLRFAVVGASGVGVNVVAAWLSFRLLFLPLWGTAPYAQTSASALGIVVSILTNFLLNDAWTWGDRRSAYRRSFGRRCVDFYAASSLAALVQLGVFRGSIALLSIESGLGPLSATELEVSAAQLIGIAVATPLNFVVNHLWTFRSERSD